MNWCNRDWAKWAKMWLMLKQVHVLVWYSSSYKAITTYHCSYFIYIVSSWNYIYWEIFTQEVFINRRNRFHLGWAIFQWAGFLWAVYAGLSRITDNKHHMHDVMAGFFIGSTTSYWVVSALCLIWETSEFSLRLESFHSL